jgi:two-component system, chemotaxis family, protein-glutamate methylesterase/glutaminase
VAHACNGQRLQSGRIYIAPPDRHLVVEPGRLRVAKGPREHGFRPAVDPLFRSAAQVYGPAAIGVILTGNLDDGVAGLWTIKKLGGTAIAQDPADALFPSMPLHALGQVHVDYKVPLSRIPSLLVELTAEAPREPARAEVPRHIEVEVNIAKEHNPRDAGLEFEEGGRIRFRCHTGHAYSVDSLIAAMNEGIEHTMSTASVRSRRAACSCGASPHNWRSVTSPRHPAG